MQYDTRDVMYLIRLGAPNAAELDKGTNLLPKYRYLCMYILLGEASYVNHVCSQLLLLLSVGGGKQQIAHCRPQA